MQYQLILTDGSVQIGQQRQSARRMWIFFWVVECVAGSMCLCVVHCNISTTQESIRILTLIRIACNAKTGPDVQIRTVKYKRCIQCFQYFSGG